MTKQYTTQAIAKALDAELIGDGSLVITRLAHPLDVLTENDLALAMDPNLVPLLQDTIASVALLSEPSEELSKTLKACLVVKRPRVALAKITSMFAEEKSKYSGIHPSAVIEEGAKIGKNVSLGAHCYVGKSAIVDDGTTLDPQVYVGEGAVIGENSFLHAGVRIGTHVKIGKRVIIHYNASIGADGFSFVTPHMGSVEAAKTSNDSIVSVKNESLLRIASLGAVIIGDDVEIGANTSIDRGTIISTRVGNGTKIDNQVQIGHNVVIGDNCLICGRVGIAGSSTIGNRVVLGGAVGIADHIKVGDDVVAMAMSGIAGHIPPRTIVGGIPALPRERLMENMFNINRIKQFSKKIEVLTNRLDALEHKLKND